MTAEATLSPRAQADLEAIWDYTAERWGSEKAGAYVRQLGQHIAAIVSYPGIGQSCDDVRQGYHKHTSGAHVVFYRHVDTGIEVVRIFHARMDFTRHFEDWT